MPRAIMPIALGIVVQIRAISSLERLPLRDPCALIAGPPAPTPVTMTAEQAAERLRAFREGKVPPRVIPAGKGLSHRSRLRRLRKRLHAIDRSATGPDSWWSGLIEEAENDLL